MISIFLTGMAINAVTFIPGLIRLNKARAKLDTPSKWLKAERANDEEVKESLRQVEVSMKQGCERLNSLRRVRKKIKRLPKTAPIAGRGAVIVARTDGNVNTQDRPRVRTPRELLGPEPRVIDPSVDRRPPSVPRGYSGEGR